MLSQRRIAEAGFEVWRGACVPRPARRDASVAGEPGATLDVLLSTAGEPGPRSIRLSSVASFSTCRARKTETVGAVERRLQGSRAEEKNIYLAQGKKGKGGK